MYRNFILNLRSLPVCIHINEFRKMSIKILDVRKPDLKKSEDFLEANILVKEPVHQFKLWLDEVCKAKKVIIPNAMCLSTATKDGAPSARIMMLRTYGKDGFYFCTYYDSRKGKEIEENPQTALTFYWDLHGRVVRIEGRVVKSDPSYTKDCFYKLQRDSQIATLCSKQNAVIPGKHIIREKEKELSEKYKDSTVPMPSLWGGYVLIPHMFEFWQGQSDKLHDRIIFRRPKPTENIDNVLVHQGEDGWVYERLSP